MKRKREDLDKIKRWIMDSTFGKQLLVLNILHGIEFLYIVYKFCIDTNLRLILFKQTVHVFSNLVQGIVL